VKEFIKPIKPKLRLEFLSEEDVHRIHEAALTVMQEAGVRFPSPEALDILQAHGCEVDWETEVVKIPPSVVEKAMKTAPSSYTMAARDPAKDFVLDGEHCYLSTDGYGSEVYDLDSGRKRLSTKRDIYDSARLADRLEAIAFYYGPMISAEDVDPSVRPLHELHAALLGTSKHVQTETIISGKMAEYCVELASMVVGGKNKLRERPIFSVMQCTMDPLEHDRGALEASLVAARYGIPTGFMPVPMSCTTAPATMAGNLVVTLVDVLSALVLLQLAEPGAPVFFAAAPATIDLRTGTHAGGSPEDCIMGGAFSQICDYYDIPVSIGIMATGSKLPDWQAAVDNVMSTLAAVLACPDMLTGAGILAGSRVLSYQQVIMDCEIYSIVKKTVEGIEVNDETLAVSVIQKVGPGGNYLAERHTLRHLGDLWQATVVDRTAYNEWEAAERAGAYEKATEMARDILTNHQPEPLEEGLIEEMDRLIRSVQEEVSKASR